MQYTVNENALIRFFASQDDMELDIAFMEQGNYPNGDEWSIEEATSWAELFLHQTDADAEWFPGASKDEPKFRKTSEPAVPTEPTASTETPVTPAE